LFHLVLVGYSANDPPMRYLLNAVAADGSRFDDLKERFTFVGMNSVDLVELEDWTTPEATVVEPNPDVRYDNLVGEDRLSALEKSLGAARGGWDDDPSSRARDWIRKAGNTSILLGDLEASSDAGAAFPRVWERFGWSHTPPNQKKGKKPPAKLLKEAARVLALLKKLPIATAKLAVEGISNWLSTWQSFIVKLPDVLAVWKRLWPVAVEATNAAQSADLAKDLNLVARPSDDHEPMDLDTLNTPAGKLVDVLLAACPKIKRGTNPFATSAIARIMRDITISSSGQSGLIVRHRLIEALQYFLRADASWAHRHLIAALLSNDADAISLWRALARRTQFIDVLKIIGPAMAKRTSDERLGRETRRSLVFSLVVECLHALNESRAPAVPYADIQQMIRSLDDELRAHAAGAIQQFVREMSAPRAGKTLIPTSEEVFERAAAPFLREVWPQERSLATPGVSKAFADLPVTARGVFAAVVDTIQRFLVPFDSWSLLDYGLFGDEDSGPKLSSIDDATKATALLRLLDSTIGTAPSAIIPYDLASALARIEAVAPVLSRDPIFRRLATAARR
jgi:hypothetical protein